MWKIKYCNNYLINDSKWIEWESLGTFNSKELAMKALYAYYRGCYIQFTLKPSKNNPNLYLVTECQSGYREWLESFQFWFISDAEDWSVGLKDML